MTQKKVIIKNRAGIHARPAALLVETANKYKSSIHLEKQNEKINAKSIMGIITLGAAYKSELLLSADGPDEKEAVESISHLFESRFEEE
jgi:phosphocarrier protein HPr